MSNLIPGNTYITTDNGIKKMKEEAYQQGRADQLKEDTPYFATDIDDKTEAKIRADERAKAINKFLFEIDQCNEIGISDEEFEIIKQIAEQIGEKNDL